MPMLDICLNENEVALYAHLPETVRIDAEVYEIIKLMVAEISPGAPRDHGLLGVRDQVAKLGFSQEDASGIIFKALRDTRGQ